MADSINKIHVSPGVYVSNTIDMKSASNSLGITKLAVVGETLKGPAFQPYWIHSQKEYQSVFGGTNPTKFKGSNFPKYELPYIAQEYLTQSDQLCVVRVLGMSGYNAGPAWAITGQKGTGANAQKYVIAVLRSKGSYKFRPDFVKTTTEGCQCTTAYDSLTYDVGEVGNINSCGEPKAYNMSAIELAPYYSMGDNGNSCSSFEFGSSSGGDFSASAGNLGRFTIKCILGPQENGTKPTSAGSNKTVVTIPVSLNRADNDYIENVLGNNPNDGAYPIYLETLYDVAWENLVMGEGYNTINSGLTTYEPASAADYSGLEPVNGILTKCDKELTKKDLGKRFLYSTEQGSPTETANASGGITSYIFEYQSNNAQKAKADVQITITDGNASVGTTTTVPNNGLIEINTLIEGSGESIELYINETGEAVTGVNGGNYESIIKRFRKVSKDGADSYVKASGLTEGHIYTVALLKDSEGVRHYVYREFKKENVAKVLTNNTEATTVQPSGSTYEEFVRALDSIDRFWLNAGEANKFGSIVYSYEDNLYYKFDGATNKVVPILCDLNDYKSGYRYSSTPWVISNAKGDAENVEVNRLFRFHTISDGAASVTEVKISIENIRPDTGQFDVVVRDYYDSDSSPIVLERYAKCTMASGKKFIGTMIGTIDGLYESKSKYITVEVAKSSAAVNSVPAGFLGYSIPRYEAATITSSGQSGVTLAPMQYNLIYDEDVNKKKQYFGISDIVGYDKDYFTYKGKLSVIEDPDFVSHGFHLDCRLSKKSYTGGGVPSIKVDGEDGYVFDTVSINARTSKLNQAPVIADEDSMLGCIYEDVKLRKFTMVFAGGFDGWDEYRDQRTNTNEYTASAYKGYVNKSNGIGYAFDSFNTFNDASIYNMDGGAITTDFYAYLAGVSLLKNPNEVDINLLATPGIDTVNNSRLINEVFEILEDRNDIFYIPTTPDKESGTGDYESEIQPVEYAVDDFLDQDIHCDYAATYYPWVKIEDDGRYLFVPATKDVVRNMAESDNRNTTQNLAPAGTTRGKVKCIKARKNLKDGEADLLYESNINPIRTFSQEGVVVFGQKTLREEDDVRNRVDIMRTLIRMRKLLSIATLGLIFEPNDNATVKSFESIVNGVMQTFIDNRAIERWHMDVDTSEEAKDRLEINATIYFKPIQALEYINFSLVVTNKETYFQ